MSSPDVETLLKEAQRGDPGATERLTALLYAELRRIAAGYLRREREGHTLQPTALVHEAFIRLAGQSIEWHSRAHFLGIAARTMRRILVEHARRRVAGKRGGGRSLTVVTSDFAGSAGRELDLIALDEALSRLALLEERPAQVVELRFFGGLEVEEAGLVLGISPATVKRDWSFARAWLGRALAEARP